MSLTNKDFLDIRNYLEDEYWITCFLTRRGLGKTHSSLEYAYEVTSNNKAKFVLTRLNFEAFKKFKTDIEKYHNGWSCSLASQVIKKEGESIAYLSSLNTYANAKGGTYNDVELMIFDEFNEDIYIENAFAKFTMLIDSFKRHRKNFKCVLLGNPINKNNWFLNAIGLRIDLKNPDDKIYYMKEYGIKVVVIGTQSFKKLSKEREAINKLASLDPQAHSFYNENEFLNDESDCVVNFNRFVKPSFKPLFKFSYGEFKYIFGWYLEENGEKYFYVDRWNIFYNDYEDIYEYSFDTLGNTSKKSAILEDDDIEDFQQQFFKVEKQNKLHYGSFDCLEDLKRFISLGSIIY